MASSAYLSQPLPQCFEFIATPASPVQGPRGREAGFFVPHLYAQCRAHARTLMKVGEGNATGESVPISAFLSSGNLGKVPFSVCNSPNLNADLLDCKCP